MVGSLWSPWCTSNTANKGIIDDSLNLHYLETDLAVTKDDSVIRAQGWARSFRDVTNLDVNADSLKGWNQTSFCFKKMVTSYAIFLSRVSVGNFFCKHGRIRPQSSQVAAAQPNKMYNLAAWQHRSLCSWPSVPSQATICHSCTLNCFQAQKMCSNAPE